MLTSLVVVTRLSLLVFVYQPAQEVERLDVIQFLAPLPIAERDGSTPIDQPLRIVIEGIVVPLRGFAGFEGCFEFLRHVLALFPLIVLLAEGHRNQVVRMRSIVFSLGNLEGVFEDLERDEIAVVTVVIIGLGIAWLGHGPDDIQIPFPSQFEIMSAGPPIQCLLVMRPGLAPISSVPPSPPKVPEGLMDFSPDTVTVLHALKVPNQDLQLLLCSFVLSRVGGLASCLRAP